MTKQILAALFLSLILPGLLLAEGSLPVAATPATALADYVGKQDDSYKWFKRSEGASGTTKYVEIILTSQTWKGIVWKHQLFILKPEKCNAASKHALLFITGGGWKDELALPGESKLPREAPLFAEMANKLQTPIAILLHVPQQPIFDGKKEDAAIAHTFSQYLKTEDPTWPLLLPMVKSAVRGMDATQAVIKQEWNLAIDTFTVSGASKRGWTTWLTGATDKRATALAPMVIDTLKMDKQIDLQKLSFGDLSEEVGDYKEQGLDKVVNTPKGQNLLKIVDPYRYRESFKQPKLIILGTNDPYWPLDALNLYYDDLPGDKYILYCPNNVHGLKDYPRIFGSLNALHHHITDRKKLPKLKWGFSEADGKLTLNVSCDMKPAKVTTWSTSAATRDFRKSEWKSSESQADGDKYVCTLPIPAEGYSAMFAEAEFEEGEEMPYFFSTNLRIVGGKK
ncbi:MAG: PhoPQ-activated pathogenicity-related family protein [Pirellulaceae bacterium]